MRSWYWWNCSQFEEESWKHALQWNHFSPDWCMGTCFEKGMVTGNTFVKRFLIFFMHSDHNLWNIFIFSMSLFTEEDQMKCPTMQLSSVSIKKDYFGMTLDFFISIPYLLSNEQKVLPLRCCSILEDIDFQTSGMHKIPTTLTWAIPESCSFTITYLHHLTESLLLFFTDILNCFQNTSSICHIE